MPMTDIGSSNDAPYLRIARSLRDQISSGQLKTGDRIPSTRELMRQHNVAMATASKVLATLRMEGLIRPERGVGSVIVAEPTKDPVKTAAPKRSGEAGPAVTTEHVVACAIAIADAEGIGALSLRRVATEVGVSTMTLYGYVSGKEELLRRMCDRALAESPPPEEYPEGWRARLELISRLQWSMYRRHPWLVRVMSMTRPQPEPHALAHTEWAMRAFDGWQLEPEVMLYTHLSLTNYVRGCAINFELEEEARSDTGITDEQWMQAQGAAVAERFASGSFPTLARALGRLQEPPTPASMFEFGLERMLDGIEVAILRSTEKT